MGSSSRSGLSPPGLQAPTSGSANGVASALRLLAVFLAVMWGAELVDSVIFDDAWQRQGIQPRRQVGLDGIAFAPFLHVGFGHLLGNTIPFLILGSLVALRGIRTWLKVTLTIIMLGGLLTWLLAGSGNHVGASGVVFGYFGFLIAAAVRERNFTSIAAAAVTLLLYSGFVWGVVPQQGISWEGHLFGAVAGAVAAWRLKPRQDSTPSASATFG